MPSQLTSVAVYCGSNTGTSPSFGLAASSLGQTLAERGISLVYGGGHVGLMGAVADAVLGHGGEAHGVITESLRAKEIAHQGLTSLRVVGTMHERKAVTAGFVHPAHRDMVLVDGSPASLLDRLAAWVPVAVSKWLDPADR